MKSILTLIVFLGTSASPVFAQQAIANRPPAAFGPVKSIRYERASENFTLDKTIIEHTLGPIQRKIVYRFTPEHKLISEEIFEADGRSSGTKSIYTYDATGQLSAGVHYLLGSFSYKQAFSYSDGGRRVKITSEYHFDKRPVIEIHDYDDRGNITKAIFYGFDGKLETTEFYKYDDKGNPTEFVTYNEAGTLWFKEIYSYKFDSYGNWIEERDRSWSAEMGKLREEPKTTVKRTITYY